MRFSIRDRAENNTPLCSFVQHISLQPILFPASNDTLEQFQLFGAINWPTSGYFVCEHKCLIGENVVSHLLKLLKENFESRENIVGRMAVIWQTGMLQDFVSILSKLQIELNGEILFKGFKFVDVG